MSNNPLRYLIIIPLIIYIFFATPSLKEWASADSVPYLMGADEISGSRHWLNFSYITKAGFAHPPLYSIILSIIRKLAGTNTIFFRLFGLICCLISIVFIYFISSKLCRDKNNYFVPLIACFIFSINPFMIRGSLHIDPDNTLITTLMLAFIFLFLKNMECLNTKNIIQLSFVFALLLSAKLTTPLILFAILFYLLINKKFIESISIVKIFILGFIFFGVFWILYSLKFNYSPSSIFKSFIELASGHVGTHIFDPQFIYDIFRALLWFSPFFLLLWLLKIIDRLHGIFQCKILDTSEDLLIIISIIIFMIYLCLIPMTHGFPKYLFPVVSIMSILIADIVAKVKHDILYSIRSFIIIIGLVLIFNIIFVGDLLYLTNYVIKERFIRSHFDVLILHKESLNMLFKLFSLLILSLAIFIFYRKGRKQRFISACIISFFIMFISSSLALNIIQYKAKYQVIYTYGKEGTKDLVRFLKSRINFDDRIIAPCEIVYYLDAINSGFVVSSRDLTTPENFIKVLKDINPTCVVYGIASNTIEQYRDVFSSNLISDYFRIHHFKSVNIGSYTLWIRTDRNDL